MSLTTRTDIARRLLAGLVVLATIGLRTALAQCTGSWEDLGHVPTPVRDNYALAYDALRDRTVLFGGFSGVGVARPETLEWDGAVWVTRSVTGPSARGGCAAVYDSQRRQIILFGGVNESIYFDETWAFDGSTWTKLEVTGPSARAFHSFTYDLDRNEALLLGGINSAGYLDDCWRWTSNHWVRVDTATPPARARHGAAFDHSRNVIVVFGGQAGSTAFYEDTWEWNGSTWSVRAVVGPSRRDEAAMVYDDGLGQVLSFGGYAYFGFRYDYMEIWTWDGSVWYQSSDPYLFPANSGHKAIYDPVRHRSLIGPGRRGGFATSQTFAYSAPTPPTIGAGPDSQFVCPGGQAIFSVKVFGPEPISYQWFRGTTALEDGPTASGSVVTGSATPTLGITGISSDNAGEYTCIVANGCGSVTAGPATLQVCVADLSCDGIVDFIDFLEFLNLYEAHDPRADFNDDGIIDFSDYLEFLNHYDAGC